MEMEMKSVKKKKKEKKIERDLPKQEGQEDHRVWEGEEVEEVFRV